MESDCRWDVDSARDSVPDSESASVPDSEFASVPDSELDSESAPEFGTAPEFPASVELAEPESQSGSASSSESSYVSYCHDAFVLVWLVWSPQWALLRLQPDSQRLFLLPKVFAENGEQRCALVKTSTAWLRLELTSVLAGCQTCARAARRSAAVWPSLLPAL